MSPVLLKYVPVLIVQEVTPQNQPSHWKNLAAAVATASHYRGFAVTATVLQFALGEERKDTDGLHGKEHPQCINEHSWAPKPLRHLQFPWERSSFAQAQGVYPEQDSDLTEKKDACSPCTFAAPIFAGCYKSSPTRNKTQYFWLKEKYTHGTASGGFLKLFKGKWKGWWLPLGEQLLHLQFIVSPGSLTREEDVWWQKPLSHRPRSSARSLYCTPKVAPGRTNSCLQLDPAPFQRVLCIQVKHRIPKLWQIDNT